MEMIGALAAAYGELERDPELRCGVVFAHGKHFSLGLDLARVAPVVAHSCQQKQGMMQELLTGRIRLNRYFKDERIT